MLGFERSECRKRLIEALSSLHWEVAEFALDPQDFGIPNRRPRYYGLFRSVGASFQNLAFQDSVSTWCFDSYNSFLKQFRGAACEWMPASNMLLLSEPFLQGFPLEKKEPLQLSAVVEDPASLDNEAKSLGLDNFEVDPKVLRRRAENNQRSDLHLLSDRTSACLTKANGKLPYGHSPLIVVNEHETGPLEQRPKVSSQGTGPSAATDHVWKEGVRVRYFSPVEQLRLLGFPAGYSFPPTLSFRDICSMAGNSLNAKVVACILPLLLTPSEAEKHSPSKRCERVEELLAKAWGPRQRYVVEQAESVAEPVGLWSHVIGCCTLRTKSI